VAACDPVAKRLLPFPSRRSPPPSHSRRSPSASPSPSFPTPPSRNLFIAFRHANVRAASLVHQVLGMGCEDPGRFVARLFRRWSLSARAFETRNRAARWAVGALDEATVDAVSPPLLPQDGRVLCANFASGQRMFDLGDRVECSLFLAAMRGDKTATGVLLVPVAVSSATPALGQLARRIPSELRTEPLPTSGNLGRRRMVWTDPERRRAGPVWGGLVGDWRATQVSVSLSDPRRRLFERLTVGESVFLTRPPGCCKTHIVREVKGALVEAGLCVAACGSSGVAAALIDGLTVHSWAGFRNGDNDVSSILRVVLDKVIPDTAKSRMALAMVLVVDEVSTLSAELITRLDEVLRDVRGRQAAFGGLAVLVSGDFLQTCSPRGRYAFNSKVWARTFGNHTMVLNTHYRHIDDPAYLSMLLRMRLGVQTPEDMDLLACRRSIDPPWNWHNLAGMRGHQSRSGHREVVVLPAISTLLRASCVLIGVTHVPRPRHVQ